MDFERLPEARANRRVVFVLSQGVIDAMKTDPSFRDILMREDAAIIHAAADLSNADRITRDLEGQGLLVPGLVLVASPYRDGNYAVLDEAVDRFGLEKWSAVSTLCGYLGAQTLSVKIVEDSLSQTRAKLGMGGGKGPVDAKLTGDLSQVDKFAAQMHWDDAFVGGEMDLARAEEFLTTSGLMADPEVRSLVEGRSHAGNLLARRTVTIDLSRESQRTIEAALTISVPSVFKVGATFDHAKETKAHYKVTLDVVFATT
jgi:hypothetical protein